MAVSFKLQYVYEAQLLRAASQLLRLPQAVIATALTFLHRFHKACPSGADEHEIAPACLFLACKVEEAQVRVNDLANAFIFLEDSQNAVTIKTIFPGLVPKSKAAQTLLVGDAYYAAKDQLIQQEQVLLRWLSFDLCIDHPYRYILNCANAAGCSNTVVATALSLLNESLVLTNLSAYYPPLHVASGALSLAGTLQGVEGQLADALTTCIAGLGVAQNTCLSVADCIIEALHAAVHSSDSLQETYRSVASDEIKS